MDGIDRNGYLVPTREQVTRLFIRNKELIDEKVSQGFIHLALTLMATTVSFLIEWRKRLFLRTLQKTGLKNKLER